MTTSTRWRIGYAALAGLDALLAGSTRPRARRLRHVTKPLLMPTLMASLIADPTARRSPLFATTLAAQGASLAGDLALLRSGRGGLVRGSIAFGLAHLAYVTGLTRLRGEPRTATRLATAGTWSVTGPALAAHAARGDRRLGIVVAGYSGILCATVHAAATLDDRLPARARHASVAGATLFLVSDALIGVRSFVLANPPSWINTAVMTTYTAGQYLLSEGARHCPPTKR